MAYITRYIFGTDKLRPNALEVRGMNGSNTGVILCSDLAVLSNWIKLISDYISILTSQKVIKLLYVLMGTAAKEVDKFYQSANVYNSV